MMLIMTFVLFYVGHFAHTSLIRLKPKWSCHLLGWDVLQPSPANEYEYEYRILDRIDKVIQVNI